MALKKLLPIILIFTLLVGLSFPNYQVKAESEWAKIDKELKEIQKEKNDAAQKAKSIDKEINAIEKEQKDLEQEIKTLDVEINNKEKELFALEKDIEKVTNEAKLAAEELDRAMKRVEERDELLKTRVRLMYNRGNVEYLEVLLGSSSFSDFLQRFSALQKIINSDKKILQDNIDDKNTIEQKKNEIDKALADLEKMYTDAENLRISLIAKQEKQRVRIASLDNKVQQLEEIKDEEEEYLIQLATKESQLLEKQRNLTYDGGLFTWPVPSSRRITSEYGMRVDPINGSYTGHKGIDIGRAPGTDTLYGADIVAAGDGVVIVASYVNGYGNTVMIDHGSGIWTLYGHIRQGGIFVSVGDEVKMGEKIAEVGSTGRSTGPHLHFEVRKDNVPVNPWDYLAQ